VRRAALVLVLVAGCGPLPAPGPVLPAGLAPLCGPVVPCPAVLDAWWQEAEVATGLERPEVHWYTAPGRTFPCADGQCFGFYMERHGVHYIVLAQGAVNSRERVQHEMIHALLRTGDHCHRFVQAAVFHLNHRRV
jgi:hypothetical protein